MHFSKISRHGVSCALSAFILTALFCGGAAARAPRPQPPAAFHSYRHPITLWVPPYAVARSQEQLRKPDVADALTHLSLQFWVPTREGGLRQVGEREVSDRAVTQLRDWGHAHGIRVMLCVYNGGDAWDWPLARAAFTQHPREFVGNLIAEMQRLKLDGIDIDLEGPGEFEADKDAFVSFMTRLSQESHTRGKQVQVESFSSVWNAPNMGWWPELFPLVDALTSMGYTESGINAPDKLAYAAQKKAAGLQAAKLQIGLPSDTERWQKNTAQEQTEWIRRDGTMGVGIWDAQLLSPAWQQPSLWRTLRAIRGTGRAGKQQ